MTDSSQLESVFFTALQKQSPTERNAYLDEACATDEQLRHRVERMLAAQVEAGSFLESPISPPHFGEGLGEGTIDSPRIAEQPGTVIGPYKLLQQIGEGGMGVVFMAEQTEPLQRTVALKIIKPGMDTRQVIARFEAERQAVAMMDHPNIAKVLDAGTTDSGRPYFVMELVKGVPITKFCDEKHLPLPARLELFVQVCQAVQHAHQKGIIHRDIKPNNVLVAEYDNRAVPKVIDFGVAKATAQRLTERTMFTQYGQIVGTFEYMSPEQARFNQLDIDTRSDIYSLGVLLYELLTGSTPLERNQLKGAAFDEMLRIIREEEPPKPSTRLSSLSLGERAGVRESLASIAANRNLEPRRLTGLISGELDWIVMKCLEKDRNRRFETASGLAADIERYLNDEQVLACPPSTVYRLKKFARRNRGPVLAGAVVLLTLVGGIIGTTFGLFRAEQARRMERQAKQVAQAREEEALEREAETKAVLEFVENKVFAAARPEGAEGGLGSDVMLRQAMETALPFVDESFADQPLIEARLRLMLGESFSYLGEVAIAAEQAEAAGRLYREHPGPDHSDTLRCMALLAKCYSKLGQHAEAFKLNEESLALTQAKLGRDHPDTLLSMRRLAWSYVDVGRSAEAIPIVDECIRRALRNGQRPPGLVFSMLSLRIRHFQAANDAFGCRTSAEMCERFNPTEMLDLYNAACYRAVAAGVFRATDNSPEAVRNAEMEADRAMELLAKAAAAGYMYVDYIKNDEDLDALRDRQDFQQLIASMVPTEATIAAARERLRGEPNNIERCNHLARLLNRRAWQLATNPDPSSRDIERAVELAQEATILAADNSGPWDALGVARYRAGDWRAAMTALQKARTLRSGINEWDNPFLMAMAQWQLGNKDDARRWYERGARWMDSMDLVSETTERIRKEAAELLGIEINQ